jgi:hypothetical protein
VADPESQEAQGGGAQQQSCARTEAGDQHVGGKHRTDPGRQRERDRLARVARRQSQVELSGLCSLSRVTIGSIERADRPADDTSQP